MVYQENGSFTVSCKGASIPTQNVNWHTQPWSLIAVITEEIMRQLCIVTSPMPVCPVSTAVPDCEGTLHHGSDHLHDGFGHAFRK